VYDVGPDKEEYNNDFRERLQSINPIRLNTRMISVVPLEQENISSKKIMPILFQDAEDCLKDIYDKNLIKEPSILNDEFGFDDDTVVSSIKNSMRYIKTSQIDTRFEDDDLEFTEHHIPPPPLYPPPPPPRN